MGRSRAARPSRPVGASIWVMPLHCAFPCGQAPVACTGTGSLPAEDGRREPPTAGSPYLKTSSLSGTFAGCVQAARASGPQVISHMSVTVVIRWIPRWTV
jgi:hypothetical protein